MKIPNRILFKLRNQISNQNKPTLAQLVERLTVDVLKKSNQIVAGSIPASRKKYIFKSNF